MWIVDLPFPFWQNIWDKYSQVSLGCFCRICLKQISQERKGHVVTISRYFLIFHNSKRCNCLICAKYEWKRAIFHDPLANIVEQSNVVSIKCNKNDMLCLLATEETICLLKRIPTLSILSLASLSHRKPKEIKKPGDLENSTIMVFLTVYFQFEEREQCRSASCRISAISNFDYTCEWNFFWSNPENQSGR